MAQSQAVRDMGPAIERQYLAGNTVRDIATELGMAEGTVNQRLRRLGYDLAGNRLNGRRKMINRDAPERGVYPDDPAHMFLLSVIERAVNDWRIITGQRVPNSPRRYAKHYKRPWGRTSPEYEYFADQARELLTFFHSPDFEGMCLWLNIVPDEIRAANLIP